MLVLGASGQIGYEIVGALARASLPVRVLVRNDKLAYPSTVEVQQSDEFTPQTLRNALVGVRHVLYCVGKPEQYVRTPGIFQRTNCDLLESFLSELVRSGCRRLTYISTFEVFEAMEGKIRETNPLAEIQGLSPYYQSMIKAFAIVREAAASNGVELTTIHPSAVYGGLNTGHGFTDYIVNLIDWKVFRVPCIFDSRFPVVHVSSISDGVLRLLDTSGHFLVSDQMTSLVEIAATVKRYTNSYVPITLPLPLMRLFTPMIEALSTKMGMHPILARVQFDYMTKSAEPEISAIESRTGWRPMPLAAGISRFVSSYKRSS